MDLDYSHQGGSSQDPHAFHPVIQSVSFHPWILSRGTAPIPNNSGCAIGSQPIRGASTKILYWIGA